MRVALLSDCYLPRLGGIEVQVHDLAHRLAAAGHVVHVVTATAGRTREHTTSLEADPATTTASDTPGSVTVHRLPLPVPGAPPVNPFVRADVRALLRDGRFDVAHAHMGVVSPFATGMVGVALAAGVPTAATWHCVIDRTAPVFRFLGHARRWHEAGVALSAVSAMAADRVGRVAGGAEVQVLGNGIDVEHWSPPVGLGVERPDDGVVRVVSALRFVRRKRPGALVDVLRAARERLEEVAPGTRLEAHLVGEGPQRRVVRAHLDRHGMGWVRTPGRLTRDELRELHWRSDVYLTTARLEAFGIAALEARTAGLAVLARSGTGLDDFVEDGRNGILRSCDADLVTGLVELASRPGELARIRAHNLAARPEQSWERVVSATLDEYARARRLHGGAS